MRKIFFTLILFCAIIINAQSLSGFKVCINPGHGGNDSNDREIPLGNGVTFWESEGNLAKGLYLKSMLESLGANVVMTRVANTSADDLALSQIVAIANSNNVDYMHAIHSNATGTSTKANYTLILFQGRTTAPTYAGSLTMANFVAENILRTNRTTRKMVAGDFDFYGTGQAYLGVFKGLNMPATLSEGSFHDYLPEAWRLKNEGYLKHEAWGIARSFLQYFNAGSYQTGIVAGIVRDLIETVPASYSPLSGTNDNYKPLNNIKVKLEPSGKTFSGDAFNNGYYFFDGVAAGNYKVIVEGDKMRPDTASVIVKANESVFSDRLMTLNPILDPPKILSYTPADSVNEVSNISPVVIDFDIRMNSAETQNAFSIIPNAAGTFKWDTEFKKMTFTPTSSYTAGTKYVVKISRAAKTHFGIYLLQDKIFSFTTRSQYKLLSIYPPNGSGNISTTVLNRITFDNGINASTLSQKISFTDSLGNSIPVNVNQAKYSQGIIEFEPKQPLNTNTLYKIVVREGIGDIENVFLKQTYNYQFRTEKNLLYTGNSLEGFENESLWIQPTASSNTKGVNVTLTNFSVLNTKPKVGDNSGRLEYTFTGKDGVIELALKSPISFAQTASTELGVWVFGDASKNILRYRFLRNNAEVDVFVDTLNWTGWKMKKIALSQIAGTGSVLFKSFIVAQSSNGILSGRLFFDEMLSNIVTDIRNNNQLPTEFKLEQNYPNPFNPTTTIRYFVPLMDAMFASTAHITLKVYDVLGREIETLVDELKQPGSYNYKLSIINYKFSSGVYFYQLTASNPLNGNKLYTETKKMVLLK